MRWIVQRPWARPLGLAAIGVAGLVVAVHALWQQQLPPEVRTLQAVLNSLSRGNNLGNEPVAFMVGSGGYTAQLAEQRGLCKANRCEFFTQLNPFRTYGNGWDELIRQGYALGDIQAWSASSGTVVITQASFRAYGSHLGFLACTVAHELAHLKHHHIFEQSYHDSHNLRGLPKQQRALENFKRARLQELEADRDAATMLARAGYPDRICEQGLMFFHRSVGDGSITEPESTHPGYEERLAAMRAHDDVIEKQPPTTEVSSRSASATTAATTCSP